MPRSNVETRWMKFGRVENLINLWDDTIAAASGIRVMFFNLTSRAERIEKFDCPERGRGVSRLAGHPEIPIFATAERKRCPKIFIFAYPGIRRVSNCVLENRHSGYLSCVFAGSEYLLTLTSLPDFRIVVWSWRTGENLTSIDTAIRDHRQRILCSSSSPYQISQLGETSGDVAVYEINACSRIIMISRLPNDNCPSTIDKVVCTSWSSDGYLFQCDVNGTVALNFNDGKGPRLIVQGEKTDPSRSKGDPLVEIFQSGFLLVDQRSRIVFYRKANSSDDRVKCETRWTAVWSVQAASHPILVTRIRSYRERLLFCAESGEIFELTTNEDGDSPKIRPLTCLGLRYKFVALMNPGGGEIVAIDEYDRLRVLRCLTGQLLSETSLRAYGAVRCIASHPSSPLMVIGTAIGKLLVMSLVENCQPLLVSVIHLQRSSLGIIRYSWSATVLGVADADGARVFAIGSDGGEKYFVLGVLQRKVKIVDFLIYESSDDSTKILLLEKTCERWNVGRRIIVCSLNDPKDEGQCECVVELANMLDSLSHGRSRREIIAVPFLTKQLHFFEIQEDFQSISLIEALPSAHQLRNIKLRVDDRFILTCSYDGLIIARSRTNVRQVVAIFMSHHRIDGGTKTAVTSSSTNTFVTLGRNGDLVATQICYSIRNLKSPENSENPRNSGFSALRPKYELEDDSTWIERKTATNVHREGAQTSEERNSILESFLQIRKRVKVLIDANEAEPSDVRLSLSVFDLDRGHRRRKIHENIANKERLMRELEGEIFQRHQVFEYLRKLCWDSMEIQGCSLLSINGKTRIDNFPVARVGNDRAKLLEWERFAVDFHRFDDMKKSAKKEIDENWAIVGTTTHRFVPETYDGSMNQLRRCPSYLEGLRSNIIARDRERKLKVRFNELFEEMRSVKDRELSIFAERLNEIQRYALELRSIFGTVPATKDALPQPLWHYTEKPETIVRITDREILNGRAATYLERDVGRETRRQREEESLRLNDDFRNEALEIMMDGLLEVRWEDEIKKDPSVPRCLSRKDPSEYSVEEKARVELYRIKCKELEHEREKYRRILQEKIVRVEKSLKEDGENFDRRVENLYLTRVKIESAILQEKLMRLRESQRHCTRRRGANAMKSLRDELSLALVNLRDANDGLTILENAVGDTRNRYDNLSKRDRALEARFRGEFPDLKQPMVEHLLRNYRKRPRNVQLTCTSITCLTEMARCVVNGDGSEILPRDCAYFLQGLNSLDAMPNNLPPRIDATHWSILCKLRRAKLESEIKMRICAVDLAEAEQTLASRQKLSAAAENGVSRLRETIEARETENEEQLEDTEVQLVLKLSQVEARVYGERAELSNSVLVRSDVVVGANERILEAGHQKLAAMRKTMVLRRATLWREWHHERLRVTLGNMIEQLRLLRTVKITREIRNYLLNNNSRQCRVRTRPISSDRVLDSTNKRYRRIFKEEQRRYANSCRNIESWKRKNSETIYSVERMKLASLKASTMLDDEQRERDDVYRKTKLARIMKRTRMKKKVEDNYGELLALRTRLELLRLKTYPTLRLKELPSDKRTDDQ